MAKSRKGIFICFEGGEGAGKTTQIRMLRRWLEDLGRKVVVTREPGEGSVGRQIRNLLLHPKFHPLSPRAEAFLYQADRSQHVEHFILPHLRRGYVVITDRYGDSSVVYQGICRKLGVPFIERLNHFSTAGLRPDVTFTLDVPRVEGAKRMRRRGRLDRIEREKGSFHNQVRTGFLKLARRNRRSHVILNGREDRNLLATRIRGILQGRFSL